MIETDRPHCSVRFASISISWCLALAVFYCSSSAYADHPLIGTPLDPLSAANDDALLMPTGVDIATDGTVYVADGVHDRIIAFDSAGRVASRITTVGSESLSRPVNVAVGPDGVLWIADTGHSRVLARSSDGQLVKSLSAPRSESDRTPEITDLALTDDGKQLWIVDNHNHRLVRFDLGSGSTQTLGSKGESIGQLNHPFMLALAPDGHAMVTDVLNGRVARFTSTGEATSGLFSYGVDLGQVYRPKGIARDRNGNIWVSDSVLGVVQAYSLKNVYLDVLRDAAGKPMRFSSPLGLAFDEAGLLHVVELGANRIARVRITANASAPSPISQPREEVVGVQAMACTVCHLEWMEPLAKNGRTELIAPPENPPEMPNVSRSETCLSCHDASVVDSRRLVWREHSHRTGIKPPEWMTVPSVLPLVDGKIACRTCHSAHANGQFQSDVATAVFLRAQNSAGELCIGCHQDKTRGPKLGTHPTGGMPWPIPKSMIEAGAKPGPNLRELTCTVCHMPHGSVNDHLLVMGTESNQLCVTCHDQMRPGMFREGGHTEHPLQPVVNAEQKAAIARLGTKLGPGDKLVCLSCHKLHHGKSERFMLADELTDSRFCINCHAGKTSVLETSHNLAVKFPDEKNRLGMTTKTGGPCSTCHMFHRYARAPEISEIDPGGGKCITCHQAGRCAETKTLGVANHSKTECVACHDPHTTGAGHFLRAPGGELCLKCHGDYAALRGGPHDVRQASKTWPAEAAAMSNECMACHRPHGDERTGLFRVPPVEGVAQQDGACLTCHPTAAFNGDSRLAAIHPRSGARLAANHDLPLVMTADGKSEMIGCRTCHNPHVADGATTKFVRTEVGENKSSLCITCHTDQAAIGLTSHAPAKLSDAGLATDTCLPCHTPHGNPNTVRADLLWPKSLTSAGTPPAGMNTADVYCANCHNEAGPGALPFIASHPVVAMFNSVEPDANGYLPLYDSLGRIDPKGALTCRTCHTPLGHLPDSKLDPKAGGASPAKAKAMRLMLRPFTAPNVCTTCHGTDALRRFLYFHDPQRRSGPLTDPTADVALRRESR
ncbi:MAG: cytochrome c3 family protein [Planctomycetota bacterium]